MSVLAVIPARMASVRFPGKPLALLRGKPIVEWVYQGASSCPGVDQVVVATPDEQIAQVVEGFGGGVERTRSAHRTGTDRVAEVAARHPHADVVVNVQGDLPFVSADMVSALVAPFAAATSPGMTTLATPLGPHDQDDPNTVKVLCNLHQDALYFSRADLPYFRTPGPAPVFRHIGLYAFSREFLASYSGFSRTPLEEREGLEQLRALEHGFGIRVSVVDIQAIEVNTPADLDLADAWLAQQEAR